MQKPIWTLRFPETSCRPELSLCVSSNHSRLLNVSSLKLESWFKEACGTEGLLGRNRTKITSAKGEAVDQRCCKFTIEADGSSGEVEAVEGRPARQPTRRAAIARPLWNQIANYRRKVISTAAAEASREKRACLGKGYGRMVVVFHRGN